MNCTFRNALFVVISLFAASANGAPVAYSVNSDSGNSGTMDSLFKIDLENGTDQKIGKLFDGLNDFIDTEGLALAPDGTLWGLDDESRTLFPINTTSGIVSFSDEVRLFGFPAGGGNDFGMTFSCEGTLYVTSVRTGSLYRVFLDGNMERVGADGALGVNISALAAYGKPSKLYGLGNGQFLSGRSDSPNLYSIDVDSGVATLIGALGAEAGGYSQGGLGFDSDGVLWAITDRGIVGGSLVNLPSQIFTLDQDSGTATLVGTTTEVGYESLAVAPPSGCEAKKAPERPETIPTMGPFGRLLAILVLLSSGVITLRRRFS